jgi:hypothetical protein
MRRDRRAEHMVGWSAEDVSFFKTVGIRRVTLAGRLRDHLLMLQLQP